MMRAMPVDALCWYSFGWARQASVAVGPPLNYLCEGRLQYCTRETEAVNSLGLLQLQIPVLLDVGVGVDVSK
jgi:hypothetical protein